MSESNGDLLIEEQSAVADADAVVENGNDLIEDGDPTNGEDAVQATISAVPRGRGRPKKSEIVKMKTTSSNGTAAAASSAAGKKRGRPAKSPARQTAKAPKSMYYESDNSENEEFDDGNFDEDISPDVSDDSNDADFKVSGYKKKKTGSAKKRGRPAKAAKTTKAKGQAAPKKAGAKRRGRPSKAAQEKADEAAVDYESSDSAQDGGDRPANGGDRPANGGDHPTNGTASPAIISLSPAAAELEVERDIADIAESIEVKQSAVPVKKRGRPPKKASE